MNKLENEQMRAAGYGAPPRPSDNGCCDICGEPMPPGEEMFRFHGYSCDCPKPPLPKAKTPADRLGKWLSAALDDPNVCEEMKADIRAWFDSLPQASSGSQGSG